MSEFLLSVCIPTYNRAQTVEKCIDNILRYEGNDIEIIFSDNCSTDDTERIVTSYSDSRLRYYRNSFNTGADNLLGVLKYANFCAMRSNIRELPDLVRLAADIGIEEVKVVYLTVFDQSLEHESLWNDKELVKEVFEEAEEVGDKLGIVLKLAHLIGEDSASNQKHKDCFVTWRDFFLGSDDYVRPCMSTPVKFFKYNKDKSFMEVWNSEQYKRYRRIVNDNEMMDSSCAICYQSSHCNWNRKESFLQMGTDFSPKWEG